MAQLVLWGYRPGRTLVHRLDPRFGLIILIMLSLSVLRAGLPGLVLFSIACIGLSGHLGMGITRLIRELRYAAVLLLFIVIARGLVTDGRSIVSIFGLTLTEEGVEAGILIAWRLLIIIVLGAIFMLAARPTAIKAAIEWYLKPVPWIPHARVGMMLGLLLRFIPVIFYQSGEVADAQRARGVERVKNPIRRLMILVIPLLRKLFITADKLATAMAARGYCDDRTPPQLKAGRNDWYALAFSIIFCALVLF